jgi:hypothetical protein
MRTSDSESVDASAGACGWTGVIDPFNKRRCGVGRKSMCFVSQFRSGVDLILQKNLEALFEYTKLIVLLDSSK